MSKRGTAARSRDTNHTPIITRLANPSWTRRIPYGDSRMVRRSSVMTACEGASDENVMTVWVE
ncbi:hypothetical protein E2C01_100396 [Portunus trituberculatus]|uniref:Uncharacterized protein n=1 Tax=Portunus trituberculatus TaxID=210409 RepID=A0A5B7KD86_PORTR|nr:hypothetical protein [Portunus trituberculatus]